MPRSITYTSQTLSDDSSDKTSLSFHLQAGQTISERLHVNAILLASGDDGSERVYKVLMHVDSALAARGYTAPQRQAFFSALQALHAEARNQATGD